MKKRILCAAVCAAVWGAGLMLPVSITENSLVIPAKAAADAADNTDASGLITEDGHFRYYEDGQPVTERWITTDGHTYYFNEDGNAAVLKCNIDGTYYVFDKDGRLLLPSAKKVVRVETPDEKVQTYYIDTKGRAVSGWFADKLYYFDKTGEMVTGITVIKEKFYSFYASGKLNQNKTQKLRKAAKYEQPFSNLKKYIGNPKKSKYYDSCYGTGKDGILTYNGFKVYTYKPVQGAEIFMGAE